MSIAMRIFTLLTVIVLLGSPVFGQPKTADQIVGTWKSNRELTVPTIKLKVEKTPERMKFLGDMFGRLEVTFTDTEEIAVIPAHDGKREWRFSSAYTVVSATDNEIVIKDKSPLTGQEETSTATFEGADRYWIPLKGMKGREYFDRVKSPVKAAASQPDENSASESKDSEKDAGDESRQGTTAKSEISEDDKRVASRFPSPSKDAALSLVKRAMLIRDPDQVEEFFRIGSAPPAEVAGFLKDMATTYGPITGYDWRSSMDANGLLIDGVLVKTKIGGKPRNRLALLTPDDKGKWRIDFEAFARTVTPPWNEILSGHASKGVVRVLFVKDYYYNGPFGDESQWTCFRLGSPDINDDILGYCRKDSPQAAAIKMIVESSPIGSKRQPLRAVLEIQRTAGAEARQFEITRVFAEDWVRSSKPFDEILK